MFASTVWKVQIKAIAELNIHQENFRDLSLENLRNRETFSLALFNYSIYFHANWIVS